MDWCEKKRYTLHKLCNEVWSKGIFPEEWTKSILVTLPKKGDLGECKNYRTISLMSQVGKVMMKVLLSRLKAQTEMYVSEEQAGFRRDRSTVQQILTLRIMAEKAKRIDKPIFNCFVDFQKAFDSVARDISEAVLESYGIGSRLLNISVYVGVPSKPMWSDFFPHPVDCATGDQAVVQRLMENFTESDWRDWEAAARKLPKPLRLGVHHLDEAP